MSWAPKNIADATALRLAAVVESSDDAIVTQTLDGTIETWNRAAERMFGYAAAEAVGRPIDLIVPANCRAEDEQALGRMRTGERALIVTELVSKTGITIPVSVAISPIVTPDGDVIGLSRIIRDLTEQRALERASLQLAAIVDSAEDAIVSKDLNGIVQTWNRAAERTFGFTAEEMIGRSIRQIIPAERQAEEDQVLARLRSGQSIHHFETVRRRKDGSLIDISLSVSPIRNMAGEIVGASKIARDITAHRRLARQAEEAGRVKDEFLATLSHELRTPLNAVLGYTRMLRTGQFAEERREHVMDIIERNAKVLSQLVSDVLDISGIVTGKIRVRPEPCNLAAVLNAAADVVRPAADAKDVELRIEAPEVMPPALCDTDRMQQVFWNLLSNAVKFTPPGGSVVARIVQRDGMAEVTVTDTGIGIRPEFVPYIFQRFWQAESVRSRETSGLGLGLALARHFVELHGGTIGVSSEGENRGSTFTIRLPLAP